MIKKKVAIIIRTAGLIVLGLAGLFFQSAYGKSPDAIAMRIISNPNHFSALRWYNEKVTVKGSPQLLSVDGYPAVRDGRSVYVSAANVDQTAVKLYTNIYIISYNQEAEQATQDIFGQILSKWRFNTNLDSADGYCNAEPSKQCLTDKDCGETDFCSSFKARITRDTVRMARLVDFKASLEKYKKSKNKYPSLAAGSYLPSKSVSVWPSWQDSLGKELGTTPPIDPINKLAPCAVNFEPTSCWDQASTSFAWTIPTLPGEEIPDDNFVFTYSAAANGASYKLCSYSESSMMDTALRCSACKPDICIDNGGPNSCGPDNCGTGNCAPGCSGSEVCFDGSCKTHCAVSPGCRAGAPMVPPVNSSSLGPMDCPSSQECFTCNGTSFWNSLSGLCEIIGATCNTDAKCQLAAPPLANADSLGQLSCLVGELCYNCKSNATWNSGTKLCELNCVDNDLDGYGTAGFSDCIHPQVDCDDSNNAINPGATEICGNAVDEDCAGGPQSCPSTCVDNDLDGYGTAGFSDCIHPQVDCNDSNNAINPGALTCAIGANNNCNASLDCTESLCFGNPGCCGDGICDSAETPVSCAADCGPKCYTSGPETAQYTCLTSAPADLNAEGKSCLANCVSCTCYGCIAGTSWDPIGKTCGNSCSVPENIACPGALGPAPDKVNFTLSSYNDTPTTDWHYISPTPSPKPSAWPAPINHGKIIVQADPAGSYGIIRCEDGVIMKRYQFGAGPTFTAAVCNASTCFDADGDGYDTCNPTDPGDTDGKKADCNDTPIIGVNIHPDAVEICDGVDNNCIGGIDETCDLDGDNYCSCSQVITVGSDLSAVCPNTNTTDAGWIAATCDCNDAVVGGAAVNPGAVEICNNSIDDNCNALTDCADAATCSVFPSCITCTNADHDGYSLAGNGSCCGPLNNQICPATPDCNDADATINPGALEICGNAVDENCDTVASTCPIPACTFPFTFPCIF